MYVSDTLAKALLRVREMEITPETTRELARRLEDEHHEVAFQTFTWPNHTDILRGVAEVEQQHMSLREIEMAEWSAEIEAEMPRLAWEFWRDWVKKYPDAIPVLTTMMTLWDVFFPSDYDMIALHRDNPDPLLVMNNPDAEPWFHSPMEFDQTLDVTSDWEKITPQTPEELESLLSELDWALMRMVRICIRERLESCANWSQMTAEKMFSPKPLRHDRPMVELALSGAVPRKKVMDAFRQLLPAMFTELYGPTPDWLPETIIKYQTDMSAWIVGDVLSLIQENDPDREWALKWEAFEQNEDDPGFTQWDPRLEMALVGYQAMAEADPEAEGLPAIMTDMMKQIQTYAREHRFVERLTALKARLNA